MEKKTKHVIKSDVKFKGLEKIDIGAIEKACDTGRALPSARWR